MLSTFPNVDSTIGSPKDSKDPTLGKRAELRSSRIVKIKLPNVFSQVAAPDARFNPLFDSDIPKEADEWTRRQVYASCLMFTQPR